MKRNFSLFFFKNENIDDDWWKRRKMLRAREREDIFYYSRVSVLQSYIVGKKNKQHTNVKKKEEQTDKANL